MGTLGLSRLDSIRQNILGQGLSERAAMLWQAGWQESTNRSYESAWTKWSRWCGRRESDPMAGNTVHVGNFLGEEFESTRQYRTLNVYRSALSSTLLEAEGKPVGQSRIVRQVMTGIYNTRPPQPRYTRTWDVATVLTYIRSLGSNAT